MHKDLAGTQRGQPNPAMKEEILGLGLRYQLLTHFTSFVAVEHLRITEGNTVRTVPVPVEMPEGVSYEGVFGSGRAAGRGIALATIPARAGAAPGKSARMYSMSRLAADRPSDQRAGEFFQEMQAQSLEKRLDELEKEGKSDAEKKPVVEQLLKLKLAAELQGLAEKVAKQGTDGNLTVGKIKVKAGRVEIRVQVTALSDEVVAKLKKLGFKELARAKSVKLLIGTIDVKQLEALAKLPEVRRIDPSS
ncbi:MAG: hypothetical protein ACYSWU_17265 [Planctomycetota bacterium]|jgi:hypothetical protein